MIDIEVSVCKYNKNGFCKYQDNCFQLHYIENCDNTCSDTKECKKRHPKPCKIYALERTCIFGSTFSYQHTSKAEAEDSKIIKNLEITVKGMSEQLKHLKDGLAELNGTTPNKSSKEIFENGKDKGFKCENCDYRCITKSKMIKHIDTKQCHFKGKE